MSREFPHGWYHALMVGGPKDGWRYRLPYVQHPKTWQLVPVELVATPGIGNYWHIGRSGNDERYIWRISPLGTAERVTDTAD